MNANNVAIETGRITADPEVKTTSSGVAYCRFTLAVDRGYAKQGEEKQTDFIDCVAWRQQAEFLGKYFSKGNVLQVIGEIQTRTYEDNNGAKRKATEIVVDKISFVPGTKSSGGQNAVSASAPSGGGIDSVDEGVDDNDTDLPF